MLKKSLVVVLVLAGAATVNADALHSWTSTVTESGNIRNDLTISLTGEESRNWTNTRLNISTPDGGQIFYGTLNSNLFHIDTIVPGLGDDSGIMGPTGSLTVPSDESETYTTVGWGIYGVTGAPEGVVYSLTLDPAAEGSVEAISYLSGDISPAETFSIVAGHVVPEPATLALLALGALTLVRRR